MHALARVVLVLVALLMLGTTITGGLFTGGSIEAAAAGLGWRTGSDSNITLDLDCWSLDSGGASVTDEGGTVVASWPAHIMVSAALTTLTGSTLPLQDLGFTWDFGDEDHAWSVTRGGKTWLPETDQTRWMAYYVYHPEHSADHDTSHDDFDDTTCDTGKNCAEYTLTVTANKDSGTATASCTVHVIDPYDEYTTQTAYHPNALGASVPTGATDGGDITGLAAAFDDCTTSPRWIRVLEGQTYATD